jgi:hypothetical protein
MLQREQTATPQQGTGLSINVVPQYASFGTRVLDTVMLTGHLHKLAG